MVSWPVEHPKWRPLVVDRVLPLRVSGYESIRHLRGVGTLFRQELMVVRQVSLKLSYNHADSV